MATALLMLGALVFVGTTLFWAICQLVMQWVKQNLD